MIKMIIAFAFIVNGQKHLYIWERREPYGFHEQCQQALAPTMDTVTDHAKRVLPRGSRIEAEGRCELFPVRPA